MSRIVISTYMVRYPLGGMLSWALQWAVGLQRLGHEVQLVEKATYPNACFDPSTNSMTDDCATGLRLVSGLLKRFGLDGKLTFMDVNGRVFGQDREGLRKLFESSELLLDIGNHGAWLCEASDADLITVLVDGEPGFTQIKMEEALRNGTGINKYDFYYSNGANIGTPLSCSPTGGQRWRHVYNPIVTDMLSVTPAVDTAPYTTVMNWQSHSQILFDGKTYGQKDIEFEKFVELPKKVKVPVEVAAAGKVPTDKLKKAGWRIADAHTVTHSIDGYMDYIRASRGEFSVAKNIFVETNSGWFSDRSAAYLACGRPVILQDTGFSAHLSCGRGLFAVQTVDEAAAAIEEIERNYASHSSWAREVAIEHLGSRKILGALLHDLGF